MIRRFDKSFFGTEFEQFNRVLRSAIVGHGRSLLDVGCGRYSPVAQLRRDLDWIVGIDAHIPSILASRSESRHDAYVSLDILEIANIIAPRSFDCVMAIDVIEHLTKEQGVLFLRALETIARHRVVVFTPNGFLPQSRTEDNPFQEHISGWTAPEMRALGYSVTGINGWRPLRGPYALPRSPRWATRRAALLSERWFESRPEGAFQILCVKSVGNPG